MCNHHHGQCHHYHLHNEDYHVHQVQGFVIEFVISLILVLVVFGAAADEEAMSTSVS